MPASDTTTQTWDVYYRRLAEMTPAERIGMTAALWRAGDSMQRAAVRRDDPNAGDAEIAFRLAVTRFGPELAAKAFRRS